MLPYDSFVFLITWIRFQLIKLIVRSVLIRGNDHEVKFHEIEIQLFQEIELSIMRSKFNRLCDQICSIIFDNFDQEVNTLIMRLKFTNNSFLNFDLMKNAAIRRSNNYQEFWPHEKCQNNLISWLKNNLISYFNLMKFDLLTLSPKKESHLKNKTSLKQWNYIYFFNIQ